MFDLFRLTIKNYIQRYQEVVRQPGLGFYLILNPALAFLDLIRGKNAHFKSLRFFRSNRLALTELRGDGQLSSKLEILFVSTKKDFGILPISVDAAFRSIIGSTIHQITILVPKNNLVEAESLIFNSALPIVIKSEEEYVEPEIIQILRDKYGERYGWVLQQLLKINFIKFSAMPGVLVVDSDTVLVLPRKWLLNNGEQLLLPSWEYHKPYYVFLNKLGISSVHPKYTFVSHHMLFQPKILKEILSLLNWNSTNEIIRDLCENSTLTEMSPFSIDYELYGQYLFSRYRGLVTLSKWSNLHSNQKFDSSEDLTTYIKILRNRYASISFHNY